jgi:hypothetical protein
VILGRAVKVGMDQRQDVDRRLTVVEARLDQVEQKLPT